MTKIYVVEDEFHCDFQWEFPSFEEALAELQKRKSIPWNEKPNRCPCQSWETCERNYIIIEYDPENYPGERLKETPVLDIWSSGTNWLYNKE